MLILNAGVSSLPQRTVTEDGIETQFQVNFLAHFLLTNLLMDELRAAAAPRILSVASVASYLPTAAVQLDNLQHRSPGVGRARCRSLTAVEERGAALGERRRGGAALPANCHAAPGSRAREGRVARTAARTEVAPRGGPRDNKPSHGAWVEGVTEIDKIR